MFRKKPDYGDLCAILEVINCTVDAHNETLTDVYDQIHALSVAIKHNTERIDKLERARAEDIDYLAKRCDRAYAGFDTLNKKLMALEEKLEAKKQTKKQIKKNKGK